MDNKDIRRANMLVLKAEFGSLRALADATSTPPNYLSQIKNRDKDRGMGDDVARRFEEKLGKPTGWMDVLHTGEASNIVAVRDNLPMIQQVPLISWVQAGDWCDAADPYAVQDAEAWYPVNCVCGPRTYALRVRGESMHNPLGKPSYEDGDIIFVDPDVEPRHKDRVIVRIDDDNNATLKQLLIDGDKRLLAALNPSWPNRIIEVTKNATICGVVVAKWVQER